jgi:capsid protein
LPAGGDPFATVQEIRELVERETKAEAEQAAADWEKATSQYGARAFSAQPAVALRPSATGLEVNVRYVTRAPERNAVEARLFQGIVDLLHRPVGMVEKTGG